MLVDTSVWIDHLRRGNEGLASLLERGVVHCHPFVIGELACGNLGNRRRILSLLGTLPQVEVVDHREALALIARHRLMGRGVGWVDVHLLAAAKLAALPLWTLDRTLAAVARSLAVLGRPPR